MPEILPCRFCLLAVVSTDGFIARRAGETPAQWASPEEQQRFLQIVARIDWSWMGRGTHEAAYRPDRRRVIFSKRVDGLEWKQPNHLWVDPAKCHLADILSELARKRPPLNCAILGGTGVHDWFLERGLIDRIELTIEPITFGRGLPLFSMARPVPATGQIGDLGFILTSEIVLNAGGTVHQSFVRPDLPDAQ